MNVFRSNILWLLGYLATIAALIWGLFEARQRVIADLSRPEAQAEWRQWQAEETQRQADPSTPVRRRPPKSPEPPALVLMRDSFAAIVAMSLMAATIGYGFVMFVIRGMAASRPPPPGERGA